MAIAFAGFSGLRSLLPQPLFLMSDASPPPLPWHRRLRIVIRGSVEEWLAQRAASKGAALAFYTLFSMPPILILVIAAASSIFGSNAAQAEVLEQLEHVIGPLGTQAAEMLLEGARHPDTGRFAATIAGLFLLFTATSAFAELKQSLDEIWHIPPSVTSGIFHIIRTHLLSFGLVLVLAFLLLVSLVIHAGVAIVARQIGGLWTETGWLLPAWTSILSFTVIACLFAVIYKMLPEVRLTWRDVAIGALGTAVLFTAGKYLIGAYLGSGRIGNSYGAAGSLLALLLWVYFSAQIFFLGAEFTRQYAIWFGSMRNEAGAAAGAAALPTQRPPDQSDV